MDASEYIDILETAMVPSVQALYGDEPVIFLQDTSAVHTSRLVTERFDAHPQFTVLDWPVKSSDLNPIENLWGCIVNRRDDFWWVAPQDRNADLLYEHATRVR
ncbi:hypothetical protein Trydic_g8402 [Trypoxylus dichotomus]